MVKTLLRFRVALLELGGVTGICVGLGIEVGRGAVFIALGVAAMLKAFELDLTAGEGDDE